jgi:hypothetical protein
MYVFFIVACSITESNTTCLNVILTNGIFPLRWKRERLIPITKPGKENEDVSIYRPINFLNVGGESSGESSNKQN